MAIDLQGKIFIVFLVGMSLFFSTFLTYGIMDAAHQKEKLNDMDCDELRDYIIEKALTVGGFPKIAKDLHKYKCEEYIK